MLTRKSRSNFEVVTVNDPAIDRHSRKGKAALEAYVQHRDVSKLVLHDAHTPTRFIMRALPHRACLILDSEESVPRRLALAFAMSLDRIEGMDGEPLFNPSMDSGGDRKAWEVLEGWTVMTDEALKRIAEALGEHVVREVGAVTLQKAVLAEHQRKAFWLPPGCTVDWEIDSPAIGPTTQTSAAA